MRFRTVKGGGISFPLEGFSEGWHKKDCNSLSALKLDIDIKTGLKDIGLEPVHRDRSCE